MSWTNAAYHITCEPIRWNSSHITRMYSRPLGRRDVERLLGGEDVEVLPGEPGDVAAPVHQRDDLVVVPVLADLLDAPVEVAHLGVDVEDQLPSIRTRRFQRPWVMGCWGPMLIHISDMARLHLQLLGLVELEGAEQRVERVAVGHQEVAEVRVVVERDVDHLPGLPFVPVRARPDGGRGLDVRVVGGHVGRRGARYWRAASDQTT